MSSGLRAYKRRAVGVMLSDVRMDGEKLAGTLAPGGVFEACTGAETDLRLSNFEGGTFENCTFTRCAFVGTVFRRAKFRNCTFTGCDMLGCGFDGAELSGVDFRACTLEGASFAGAVVGKLVAFQKCSLEGADLRFYECEPGEPRFAEVNLRQAVFAVNCEFWNATFDDAATADFGRVWARASKNPVLIEMVRARWGAEEYDAVDTYMRRT